MSSWLLIITDNIPQIEVLNSGFVNYSPRIVSTIVISRIRFAGPQTARKVAAPTVRTINSNAVTGNVHASPHLNVIIPSKISLCSGNPMIQPRATPLPAFAILQRILQSHLPPYRLLWKMKYCRHLTASP